LEIVFAGSVRGEHFHFSASKSQSISTPPTLPDLKVKIVAGGALGGADIADYLALLGLLSRHGTDGEAVGTQAFINFLPNSSVFYRI